MPQNYNGMGVAVADYDNDGFEDLYVTGFGATRFTATTATALSQMLRRGRAWEREAGAPAQDFLITTMTASSTYLSRVTWIGRSKPTAIAESRSPVIAPTAIPTITTA